MKRNNSSRLVVVLLLYSIIALMSVAKPIVATTPLFASRLIDSLRILELIAWTERAVGREIADGEIRTDNFASAARIVDTFAAGGADAHR